MRLNYIVVLVQLWGLGGFSQRVSAMSDDWCRYYLLALDPSKYVPRPNIHTDGRGQLVPPIGSKIFIAWRNRTPRHVPDSAYFRDWLEPKDVLRMTIESQGHDGVMGARSTPFSRVIAETIDAAGAGKNTSMSFRALVFVDAQGETFAAIVRDGSWHDATARRILEQNPDLYFLSAEDFNLTVRTNDDGKIIEVLSARDNNVSNNISTVVKQAEAPSQLRPASTLVTIESLFRGAMPSRLSGSVRFDYRVSPPATTPAYRFQAGMRPM